MATASQDVTVADLLYRLGGISASSGGERSRRLDYRIDLDGRVGHGV